MQALKGTRFMTNEIVKQRLTEKFGEQLTEWEEPYGLLTVRMPAELNLKVMQYLYDSEELRFRFLTDLTGVHYPTRKGEELCVVYHLHNMVDGIRLRLKVYVPVEKPDVYTASQLFSGANWMERKEYVMEDPTRRDKDDEMFGRG